MKKLFVVLVSMFLCLAISDVGSVYAKDKGTTPGSKAKSGKVQKQKKGNPPGPKGGPGAGPAYKKGKGNPPGPKGGPGAGPRYQEGQGNRQGSMEERAVVDSKWEKRADANGDGIVDQTEKQSWDNRPKGNPPGPKGGPGKELRGQQPAN